MRKRLGIAAVAAVAALTFAGGAVAHAAAGPQDVRAAFFANWDRYGRGYLVNQIPADRLNVIDYAFARSLRTAAARSRTRGRTIRRRPGAAPTASTASRTIRTTSTSTCSATSTSCSS